MRELIMTTIQRWSAEQPYHAAAFYRSRRPYQTRKQEKVNPLPSFSWEKLTDAEFVEAFSIFMLQMGRMR
jgi:hypothetical protein